MLSQNAIREQPWALRKVAAATAVFLIAGHITVALASNEVKSQEKTPTEQCRLVPANPPGFKPLAFVPTVIKDKRFKNRRPRLSVVVGEDGVVKQVKVVKGTGAPPVDADIIKSIKEWKFKPQAGCVIESALIITIDIGSPE